MSHLRMVLRAGEVQRRLKNSDTYARVLFDVRLSPLLQDAAACTAYVDDVTAHAAPDATLQRIVVLNTRARRDALRHAALAGGDPSFVSTGLRLVVQGLRQAARTLVV